MPVGLYPRESADILNQVPDDATSAPPEPSFTAGSLTAPITGVEAGAVKVGEAVKTAATSYFARNVIGPMREAAIRYGGMGGAVPDIAFLESTPEEVEHRQAMESAKAVEAYTPNPHTVGTAGQMLHGLASGLTEFVGGTVLTADPLGGAALVGASEGATTRNQLIAQGVDKDTADRLGAGSGLFAGGMSMAPGGFGKTLLQRVLTGSAAQTTFGVANRGLMHTALDDAGYAAQAQQYKALDGIAMMSDAVLGFGFGAAHHIFAPSAVDAAHTVQDAMHVENSAPGVPIDTVSRDNHVDNMNAATEAMIRGEDMPELKDVATVQNAAQDVLHATIVGGVRDAAREVTGEPVARPDVAQEHRQDGLDRQRIQEFSRRGIENLSPEETRQFADLLESDRLAAKVGGRRIRGVLNDDAYAEMLDRGETKPTQGFVDLDMLKSINDTLGHSFGDQAIRKLGETLSHYFGEGNAFRRSSSGAGDEFIVQSGSDAEHQSKIEAARQHLANHKLRAYDADGNLISEHPVGFSHGSGKTVELAEQAAYADKQLRKEQGLRTDRGDVVAKPAAERGASGAGESTGTKAGGEVKGEAFDTAALTPETREAVEAAQGALEKTKNLKVMDPDTGELMSPETALRRAMDNLDDAKNQGLLHQVAAACFARA